jgi:hypothetical protein
MSNVSPRLVWMDIVHADFQSRERLYDFKGLRCVHRRFHITKDRRTIRDDTVRERTHRQIGRMEMPRPMPCHSRIQVRGDVARQKRCIDAER